ncbi:hypothetical protein DOTSEDRAFT_76701 [Dothistroma septosporum NZE10]|uniref:DUF7918 domain-containing protein n=1 Tax=Dothistroma septosporum (strain NZE10 / CBS 128990) TaxID=675120 RepID=N1Q0S1_DOTSN|nr:hypothetical protein DOTSEDRAFT_76701 [Dothistroma septosporum NZE10]
MPTLKQITCSIQLGPTDTTLKEYGHRFTDGGVQAFVAVPATKIPFNVRVTSCGYIAPGLAAYVFMDGQYQCNRNRQRLQFPALGTSARDYEVDFRLRQKEDRTAEGTFVAREWTFAELKTDDADRLLDTNPVFAKNVGTIEVVILRCRGDTVHDPAETVVDDGDEVASVAVTRAPSMCKSAPAAKARSSARAALKAPTKEPSAAADDALGMGMVGLFDGAGDDPDYVRRMPGYYDDRSPLPRYRQDLRDNDRDATRPFTAHGHHGNRNAEDQRERPYDTRPRTANDHHLPHGTPRAGYDLQQRRHRRHVPESGPPSPMQRQDSHAYQPTYTPRAAPSSVRPRMSAPEGFTFILDICKEIDHLSRLSFSERQKCAQLSQEAHGLGDDPEVHLIAMKALRHKQQETEIVADELRTMYQSIYARMRRMDPKSWQYTRDFLVLEARLFSPNDPQMQQWPDPRVQQHLRSPEFGATQTSGAIDDRTGPKPRSDDDWEEQGQGETSGGLHQRQLRKQSGTPSAGLSAHKSVKHVWGASSQQGNGNEVQDAVDQQADDGNRGDNCGNEVDSKNDMEWKAGSSKGDDTNWNEHGKKSESKKDGNDGWDGDGNAQPSNDANGWRVNNDDNDLKQRSGWSNQKDHSNQEGRWPSNDDGAQLQKGGSKDDNGWASDGNDNVQQSDKWNDNQSRTSKSKVDQWKTGDQKSQPAAGWGGKSNAKSRGGDGGCEEVGAGEAQAQSRASSRRPARSSTSIALQPIIKPYWADWNKPQQDVTRPRVQPRDPYEYPRVTTVLAPAGRARDVSHGVQAGRGAHYAHKTFRPEYLDTMDKPYAIFTFKYRSQAALERILKRKIDTRDTKRAVDEAEKEKLMRLPKNELVEEMLKMRLNPPGSGGKPASAAKAPSNNDWGAKALSHANGWGGDQQRDDIKPGDSISAVSAKGSNRGGGNWGADDKKSSSRKSKANDGDEWGANAGNDQNGGRAWANNDDEVQGRQKSDKKSKDSGWGDGEWQADNADKDQVSSESQEHFPGDAGLQTSW